MALASIWISQPPCVHRVFHIVGQAGELEKLTIEDPSTFPYAFFHVLRATSHTILRAHDHYTPSTVIGGKGRTGPSLLHTML